MITTTEPSTPAAPTSMRGRLDALADPLVRNGLLLAANTGLSGLLGFATWIIASRTVGAASVGAAQGLVATATLATLVANLGLGTALVQELPRSPDDETWMRTATGALQLAAVLGALGGLVALGLVAVAVPTLLADGPVVGAVLVVGTMLWTTSLVSDFVATGARRGGLVVARNGVFAVVKLALTAALVAAGHRSTLALYGAWPIASALSIIVSLVWAKRLGRGPLRRGSVRTAWRTLRHSSLANHGVNLGAQAPGFILPLLVVAEVSTTANAYVGAAVMTCAMLSAWSPAVSMSLLTEGSHGRNWSEAQRRTFRLLATTLGPGVLIVVLGRDVVLRLFGPAYPEHAAALLVLLAIGTVPDAVSNVAVVRMRVERRYRDAIVLNTTIAVVMVGAAAALLPVYGIVAVGYAWLAAQLVGAAMAARDLRRHRAIQ